MGTTWMLVSIVALSLGLVVAADKFSCEGRASGYYADVDTGCQVYHMCDGLGRQFSYSCPNTTLFQQRMLICDHWYMVNCSKSELDYNANLLIGQRDKPFVEDSSEHPYHRTPRPDLLQQPYAPRYQDDSYRQGRAQASLPSSLNLVGVATDDEDEDDNSKNYTTQRPQYFLPSHWSTQYGKGGKGANGERKIPPTNFNYDPKYYKAKTNPPSAQRITPVQKVATTKNTSLKNNPTTTATIKTNVPARLSTVSIPKSNQNKNNIPPRLPVLPTIPLVKDNQIKKFSINHRADSGNIPDTINEASVSPSTLALPPFTPKIERKDGKGDNISKPSIYYQPPKLSATFEVESSTMDPQTFYKLVPSKVLLPPISSKLQDRSSTISSTSSPSITSTTTTKTINKKDTEQNQNSGDSDKRWKELREMFFIPEYDFPLEVASRPSYESGLSSFQVNPAPPNPEIRIKDTNKGPGSGGINPDCPKCDPAFLAPGTCKPCVMIRR